MGSMLRATLLPALAGGLLALSLPGAGATPASAQETGLYRTVTVRAAPGRLLELMELYREEMALLEGLGEPAPLWMRHSQGDHWDLMLMYPMGDSRGAYWSDDRVRARSEARAPSGRTGAELRRAIREATAWREELVARGPGLDVVADRWRDAGLFHVEMFEGLPGKREELLRQRRMENDYLEGVGRDANLIFVREGGASTDLFTLGFYRDLVHFAEPAPVSDAEAERVAVRAGFEGRDRIGTYLRSLIARHHDTLATAID